MREQAIVLNQLTKHYGTHRGINDLSFSVNEGEFFGFIGPNGDRDKAVKWRIRND